MSSSEPHFGPGHGNRWGRLRGLRRGVVTRPLGEQSQTAVPPEQPVPIPMRYRVKGWAHKDISPQIACPLYDGRIPPEIRTIIFELALTQTTTPYLKHDVDFDVRYDHALSGDAALTVLEDLPAAKFVRAKEDPETGMDWLRPGFTGRKRLSCGLLQTCRRVYLETEHLPHSMREHVLYCGRQPRWETSYSSVWTVRNYFQVNLPREVASRVRELHIFPQLFWLESEWIKLCQLSSLDKLNYANKTAATQEEEKVLVARGPERMLDNLRKLHITLRFRDFWWNESFTPPCLNPFEVPELRTNPPDFQHMYADMAAAKQTLDAGGLPEQRAPWEAWGMTFAHMPALTTLVIDFEAVEERVQQMEAIVDWARTWRFQVYNNPPKQFLERCAGHYYAEGCFDPYNADPGLETLDGKPVRRSWLSADNTAIEKMSWRGRPYHLPEKCPSCRSASTTKDCGYCQKRARLNEQGKGPRLYVWTVTWKAYAEKVEERSTDPTVASSSFSPGEAGESTDATTESSSIDAEARSPLTMDEVKRLAEKDQEGWSVYF